MVGRWRRRRCGGAGWLVRLVGLNGPVRVEGPVRHRGGALPVTLCIRREHPLLRLVVTLASVEDAQGRGGV